MHLESDEFTITYDPAQVSVAAILEKIRGLGYEPQEIVAARLPDAPPTVTMTTLPKLVASELAEAVEADKLLLLDFYAAWCAPCQVLEKKVLPDRDVQRALEGFRLMKVDTDRYPEVAEYFKIKALPTLIVLDRVATSRFRHMGLIDAADLVRELKNASGPRHGEDAR